MYFRHHYSLDISIEMLKVCTLVSIIFVHKLAITGAVSIY